MTGKMNTDSFLCNGKSHPSHAVRSWINEPRGGLERMTELELNDTVASDSRDTN